MTAAVASPTVLRDGTSVGGYRLVRRIGGGSQAEVWVACRLDDEDHPVALRVLRADLAESPHSRAAFLRANDLIRGLRSGSILVPIEAGDAAGVAYQALPLVRGGTLAQAIESRRATWSRHPRDGDSDPWWDRLGPGEYRRTMAGALAGVARGVAEAHERGIVHRDIKPSNILLDGGRVGEAILADFGLGAEIGREPPGSACSRTPMYMPPERLLGLPCDEVLCDIYALGATLYEALTLRHPRRPPEGLHRSAVPAYLARAAIEPPRAHCPHLSRRVEAVVLRAMAPDPAVRYRSARALADDLDRAGHVV